MPNKKQKSSIKAEGGEGIAIMLKRHGRVKVNPLGIFETVTVKGRKIYDFGSKEMKRQPPTKIITFKASRPFKEFIKGKRKSII